MSKNHSSNTINIIHLNAQSLYAHIDDFRSDLQSCSTDIALVSETWLKTCHSDGMISVGGYNILRNDRPDYKRGGGVAIYFRNSFKCNLISKSFFLENCCEFVLCEIFNKYDQILIGCVYKPPNCTSLQNFFDQLHLLCGKYINIVIGGDFNIDILQQCNLVDDYKFQVASSGLSFVNTTTPTHFQQSPTLLDHIHVSDISLVRQYQQLSAPAYSKHDLLYLSLYFNSQKPIAATYNYRNFNGIDDVLLLNNLNNINWHGALQLSVHDCVQFMEQAINKLFDDHVPLIQKKASVFINPWMTSEIYQLRRRRDLAYVFWKRHKSDSDCMVSRQNYTNIRNLLTSKIRNAKTTYYSRKLEPHQSSKTLWKELRSIGVKEKCQQSCELDPNSLINSFFPSVQAPQSQLEILYRSSSHFEFHAVTPADVIFAIRSLKSNAVGLDGVSLKFVKYILPAIINFLTDVFNRCFAERTFPNTWKIAKVIPVPKKGSSEFRPISILPCLSKVFEKLISKQITYHLNNNKLFNKLQSGFRRYHSCKSAVLHITEDIRAALDDNKALILVLIDFSKAFDTIIHSILADKLILRFGFTEQSADLIRSYLQGRRSFISSNNSLSTSISNVRGVPQGSILGPLLFCMYIDDMSYAFNNTTPHYYADDTQIYKACELNNLPEAVSLLNKDLINIWNWSNENGLSINARKTQCIVFSRKCIDVDALPPIIVNGAPINYIDKVNNLGILMCSNFKWNDEITKNTKTIYFGLRCLWNNASILPTGTKLKLVQSLLCPFLSSSEVVTGKLSGENFRCLQRAFNSMIRFVHNLKKFDHISNFKNSIVGLPLEKFLSFRRLVFLFNIILNKEPEYLYQKLAFLQSNRRGVLLQVPSHRFALSDNCFFINETIAWNQLPIEIRSSSTSSKFMDKLKKYLISLN